MSNRGLSRLLFPLLDFCLPTNCFVCAERLGPYQHLGACIGCWTRLRAPDTAPCPGCGLPGPRSTDLLGPARGLCARCVVQPGMADRVLAAVEYDDVARRFLLRAKLGKRPELLDPLARQLVLAVRARGFETGGRIIVAVPSHPLRDLARGFSPARLIARRLARDLELPEGRRVLRRRLLGETSIKRHGARRRRHAAGLAFRAPRRLNGERVLLIDDVMTSGATVDSCARALRESGAAEVRAVVWARTPRDGIRHRP